MTLRGEDELSGDGEPWQDGVARVRVEPGCVREVVVDAEVRIGIRPVRMSVHRIPEHVLMIVPTHRSETGPRDLYEVQERSTSASHGRPKKCREGVR